MDIVKSPIPFVPALGKINGTGIQQINIWWCKMHKVTWEVEFDGTTHECSMPSNEPP